MTVLAITGGTGFVGTHLIQRALDQGYIVRALYRSPDKIFLTHPNLTWMQGGLETLDPSFFDGTDSLIHLAGVVKAKHKDIYYRINAQMAGHVARCASRAGVKRVVLVSSLAAREPHLSDYAGSKYAGELAVQAEYSGPLAIIRAPAVFGPGDEATRPFFQCLQKGFLPVPGGRGWRQRKISLVYVKDLAQHLLLSAVDGVSDGKVVSPATLPDISWIEFAKMCSEVCKRSIRVVPLPMFVLYPVAALTSVTQRLFDIGHLTLQKLGELTHEDWRSDELIIEPTSIKVAITQTLEAINKHDR